MPFPLPKAYAQSTNRQQPSRKYNTMYTLIDTAYQVWIPVRFRKYYLILTLLVNCFAES